MSKANLTIDADDNSATYSLIYSSLSSKVTQAHFHFGKTPEGGIYAFLCTNLGNGPAGTPACPAAGNMGRLAKRLLFRPSGRPVFPLIPPLQIPR